MARVLGIGGIFFKSRDTGALAQWYENALGLPVSEWGSVEFSPQQLPEGAYHVWGPFKDSTEYFQPSEKPFMVNLIVDDVATALDQVKAAGGQIVGEIEDHPYGTFGWFTDPEGTKVELWKPKATDR